MYYVIIGPQGSGKGTQSHLLATKLHLHHFSTGDALRAEIEIDSQLGREVHDFMQRGELVPAKLLTKIIEKEIAQHKGALFDGYPRTVAQAEFLSNIVKISAVITLRISDEEAIRRISARLICTNCHAEFNAITIPPKKQGICDKCKHVLHQREDDTPQAVKKRLEIYHKETERVLNFFEKKKTLVFKVNGEQSIEEVYQEIIEKIEGE